MNYHSEYLTWYIHQKNLTYDLRSSGITTCPITLKKISLDFGKTYAHGNPCTLKVLSQRYKIHPENIFLSSEGTSGQNTRIIRYLAEKYPEKKEAIIEYPTYEPLLRLLQEYYPNIYQIERLSDENYRLDIDSLKKKISKKTGILVLTNPHAPSSAVFTTNELREIMSLAQANNFFVLCDEIYAEFNRETVPPLVSIDPEHAIVTTSFTKAYGLGGLKLGIILAQNTLIDNLYQDALFTVGNSSNVVEHIAAELLTKYQQQLDTYLKKYLGLKKETEQWLEDHSIIYHHNTTSITYWIKTPIPDTYTWVNKYSIPKRKLAVVPGAFFLFKKNYRREKTSMIRLGLGNIQPDTVQLTNALAQLDKALKNHKN